MIPTATEKSTENYLLVSAIGKLIRFKQLKYKMKETG